LAEATEINAVEVYDEMDAKLDHHHRVLMSIEKHKAGDKGLNDILRVLKR